MKNRKTISLAIVTCLLSALLPLHAFAFGANDISGHWAAPTIQKWIDRGYIRGYPDGSFKPDQDISRAEFVTLVNTAFSYEKSGDPSFRDVRQSDWFYLQLAKAKTAGYFSGYPDGTARPDQPLTREEAAAVIFKIGGLTPKAEAADIWQDSAALIWSKGAVGAVYTAGSMAGYPDGTFRPQMKIKRGEVIVALDSALGLLKPPPPPPLPGGGNAGTVAPINPIDIASVLAQNGIPYAAADGKMRIGSHGELLLDGGSVNAAFDGLPCTLPYAPTWTNDKMVIDPDFFKKFLGATYSRSGDVVLPNYVKQLLRHDFSSKPTLYQTPAVGEDAFLNAIRWQTGWNTALELGAIGSATEGIGFRTGGTDEGFAAASLVKGKLEATLGDDAVQADAFSLYAWRYLSSSLKLTAGGVDQDVPAVSAVGTKATAPEGIHAEVVDIGMATKQDFAALAAANVDLTGKIALIAVDLDYVPWQSQACYSAAQHGAIGVIYYCESYYAQYENDAAGQTAFNVQDWSGSEIDIPVVNIPKKDGLALKSRLGEGAVEATLISTVEITENSNKGLNVYAVIKGSKYPDEYVMVNAHSDAYFSGFQDDSIAVGALVSFAEAFANSGVKPERSVILLNTDGEEFGAMDIGPDWLVGSWMLMKDDANAAAWKGKIVASLTLELMAYAGAEKFEMRACDTLYEYIATAAQAFPYRGHNAEDKTVSGFNGLGVVKNEVSNMSDEFTMVRYGVPTFRTNTHSTVVENIYHTQFDSPNTTSEGKYRDCLNYYGTYLIRLCNGSAAPYDLTKTADKYVAQVDFAYLKTLGYDEALRNQAFAYQNDARKMYLKNALILKLVDYAARHGVDLSSTNFGAYNRYMRQAAGTIIAQSTHLSGESVTFEIPYYVKLAKTLTNGLASLKKGLGPASETIFKALPARYYTNYLEYDCWYQTNADNINLGARDVLWANDIKVQYLDIYHFYQGLKLKKDGDDFSGEIQTVENWLKDEASPHLAQAISDDVRMFTSANQSLAAASAEADRLIDSLMRRCGLH